MAGPLIIFCKNVRGLADGKKSPDALLVEEKKLSVYYLMNIHISPANHNAFLQEWGNEIIINSFCSESRRGCLSYLATMMYPKFSKNKKMRWVIY